MDPLSDQMPLDEVETTKDTDTDGLFQTIREWVQADIDHSSDWRTQAKKEFAFVAGPGQWEAEDLALLKEQKRPVVTFNKTLKFIRSICGLEVNNRQMTTYLPRDVRNAGEVKANELLTNASDWMSQGCDAPRQQSRAFRDTTICGMGWTVGEIDFDEDAQGKYIETRANPLEMGWDCNARDQNLADSKRRWRIREMTLGEARALIPGVTDKPGMDLNDLDASWAGDFGEGETSEGKTKTDKERREENLDVDADPKRRVKILQIQWWELETYVRTVNPTTGQEADMTPAEYERMNSRYGAILGQDLPRANLRRKVWKQAFVGGKVLEVGPCPRRDGFTMHCITGEPDDTAGTWYGMTRVLMDPQTYSNKFFSQLMHLVNATAKGGILAESDAFADVNQAMKTYARPDAVTIVNPGAIQKGKIMPKPGAALSGGVFQLLQVSDAMFAETTGMNMELMGLADRQQPGVLEAQRKQAAMTILATLFDSLSAFRREVGAMRLTYIQDYLADGRLIRIHGDDGHTAVPLIQDQTLGKYDVIVDDAPSSTNMKEKAWSALMTLLPTVQHMLTPEVVVMLLDYVPHLPSRLVEELKKIASQPPPAPPPEVQEMAKRKELAAIEKDESAALKSKTAAVLDLAKAAAERAGQQAARIQAVDAELAAAGLVDRPQPQMYPDEPIFEQAPGPLRPPPLPNMEPAEPMNPVGAPNIALPGGLTGT